MKQELLFYKQKQKIYGHLWLPDGKGPFPCVIICHGFGANLSDHEYYAEVFSENGIAAYCFDFIGGGEEIQSDGKMTEMSVLSEADDLDCVIDGIRELDMIDQSNLFLMGGSQGGYVITYTASRRPHDIRGLIPLYPAYVIHDFVKKLIGDTGKIPETFRCLGCTVSSLYASDAFAVDIYSHMDYPGPVLIIHGTADSLVPLSYSRKAVKVFPHAKLVTIEGADHGFYDEDEIFVANISCDFVKDVISGTEKDS